MSLAMEKTRSLQQLFTSRLTRDLTGVQTSPTSPTPAAAHMQTVKVQEGGGHLEAAASSRSPAQTVRPPPGTPEAFREPQKQTSQDLLSSNQSLPVFHPQTSSWTRPSPDVLQTESTSQSTSQSPPGPSDLPSGLQDHSWISRDPSVQIRSTAGDPLRFTSGDPPSVQIRSTSGDPPSVHSSGRREDESGWRRESASLSVRRVVWSGSVSDRTMFLDRRAEWSSAGHKVELRKPPADIQTSAEPPASVKTSSPEGRPGLKLAELSPTKVLERPEEDKWPRKTLMASSSPPTLPSGLQSDSSQPSWMELAKRKSMAWSDKSMD